MAIDRLGLYNIAMLALGERTLASLSEAREPRRLLDTVWSRGNGAIRACLEQGLWNHGIRSSQIDSSSSVTPAFGFTYAFDAPTDFVRLVELSADEYFNDPLIHYEKEGAYIYADVDPIYIRYVSDDSSYGGDLSLWPETFSLFAGHWLALQIAPVVKNNKDVEELRKLVKSLLVDARSKDAQQERVRFYPLGSWARARMGGIRRDRGSRSTLIG